MLISAETYVTEIYNKIQDSISKVLIGKTDVLKLSFIALMTDGHILLEGVPGVAKTLIAKAFARSIGLYFRRIQFTPDMMPSDITGTFVFNPIERTFDFREGPIFSNVLLADEINRAPPKTQSALLEGMQERQVTVEGFTKVLPKPFLVMATQNPIELEGTYPLPEAQLDRFMFRAIVELPSHTDELGVLEKAHRGAQIEDVAVAVTSHEVEEARLMVEKVYVSKDIMEYIVSLVEASREDKKTVLLGGSPRASVHLMNASKCRAALSGRDYVIPDDVKGLIFHILGHRIILNPEYVLKFNPTNAPLNYEGLQSYIQKILMKAEPPR